MRNSLFVLASLFLFSGCWVAGSCVNNAACSKYQREGETGTTSGDCTGMTSLLGSWKEDDSGGDTIKVDSECQVEASACSFKGYLSDINTTDKTMNLQVSSIDTSSSCSEISVGTYDCTYEPNTDGSVRWVCSNSELENETFSRTWIAR